MYKIAQKDHPDYIQYIDAASCGAVYPFSVAEGIQSGDIFSDSGAFLYWHYSGFAFLYGKYGESFLETVTALLSGCTGTNPRRFILLTSDESVVRFFREKENFSVERRIFFEYGKELPASGAVLPDGYTLCAMDGGLMENLNGNITPRFSWDNPSDFLKRGKGFCVVHGERAVSWAFTAAVSSKEIDIGTETAAGYQRLGLAAAAVENMIRYCFEQHKKPVWACHADNVASRQLAEKSGFVKLSECWTVKKITG